MRYDSHIDYFAFDCRNPRKGMKPVSFVEALELNSEKHKIGIFAPVNLFHSSKRTNDNVKKIAAWAIDIDDGDKEEQLERLRRAPLQPSIIVESKRGYHAYWLARDGKVENYREIVRDRLVPFFKGDKNAADLARVLRVPGFRHWKDPEKPFMVREIFRTEARYRESQMQTYFLSEAEKPKPLNATRENLKLENSEFWKRWDEIGAKRMLEDFSGKPIVSGQHYSFRRLRTGKLNIYADNKLTPNFIDTNDKIGGGAKAGPTFLQWAMWFGASRKEAIEQVKRMYPQLEESS